LEGPELLIGQGANWGRVLSMAVLCVATVGVAERLLGLHNPVLVVLLQVLLMRWALLLLHDTRPALASGWFQVKPWEPGLYRRFGVYSYRALLRRVGWEAFRRDAQGFDGSRGSIGTFERMTREAEYSHLLLLLICAVLLLALVAAHVWDTSGWLLGTTVFFHLYPVMLQRTLRARLQCLKAQENALVRPGLSA